VYHLQLRILWHDFVQSACLAPISSHRAAVNIFLGRVECQWESNLLHEECGAVYSCVFLSLWHSLYVSVHGHRTVAGLRAACARCHFSFVFANFNGSGGAGTAGSALDFWAFGLLFTVQPIIHR
jgi:hypothetical protein